MRELIFLTSCDFSSNGRKPWFGGLIALALSLAIIAAGPAPAQGGSELVGMITTVAGNGQDPFDDSDEFLELDARGGGGPATQAFLAFLLDVAVAPDGTLYTADHVATSSGEGAIIWKVDSLGIITRFAGNGTDSITAVNGLATDTGFLSAGIATGADGSVFVAGDVHHVVWRIDSDGTVMLVAGTLSEPTKGSFAGVAGFGGDGGLATEALLNDVIDVVVGDDGSIYIAERGNRRIRKVDPQGMISTIAGGGNPLDGVGDGGLATAAQLERDLNIALAPDGSLYVLERFPRRLRKILPDGFILGVIERFERDVRGIAVEANGDVLVGVASTVERIDALGNREVIAGGGSPSDGVGDGGLATEAIVTPERIALGPEGSLFIIDRFKRRVRKVSFIPPTAIPLRVTASAFQIRGEVPFNVQFSADAEGGSPPYTLSWVFGDSSSGSGAMPEHEFTAVGSFIARATVSDSEGAEAIGIVQITVVPEGSLETEPTPDQPLMVEASAFDAIPPQSLTVQYNANGLGGVPPYSFFWEFGDDEMSTEQNPLHTYAIPLEFRYTVTVEDSTGATATFSDLISVFFLDQGDVVIDSIEPSFGRQGTETLRLTFFGIGFEDTPDIVFRGGGVIIRSVIFEDETRLTVDVSITPTARVGFSTIELTNPSGSMALGSFEIRAGAADIAEIAVDSVEPAHAQVGSDLNLLIFGVGFQEGIEVLVRGGGVVVTTITRTSATQLIVQISITSTASEGVRQVILTNPDGSSTTGDFSITLGIAPDGKTITPTGITRVRPQVLAAGIDPVIVDRSDTQIDFIAIVRPGAVPIERVTFSQNTGGFSFTLQPSHTLGNGDVIFRGGFSFERGSFGTQVLATVFGPNPEQFNFSVIDQGEQRHRFPDIEFGNTPFTQTMVSVPVLLDNEPGIKRVRPQVLAAGIDPILVDTNDDTSIEMIALVRAGSTPIRQVTFSENFGPFSVVLLPDEELPNGDVLYRGRFEFSRGSFGESVIRAVFGPDPGQFNFVAIDEAQQRHAFPNLTFGDFPPLQ